MADPIKRLLIFERMKSFLIDKRFIIRNLCVWGVFYLLLMTADFLSPNKTDAQVYWNVTFTFGIAMAVFYGNFRLCEVFFISRKWIYFLSLLALLAVYLLVIYFFMAGPIAKGHAATRSAEIIAVFTYMGLLFTVAILFSAFYWSVLFGNRQMKRTAEIQLDLQRMENEKVSAEKRFLQSQVNPHFLYNTLNFFYARSLPCSRELSDGIMTLSSIMRYSLEQKENEQGLVALEDEVEHVRNVIYIHQLRFNMKLHIDFTILGSIQHVRILPFVLITLVENAIKHGALQDSSAPVRIELECDHAAKQILFSVYNRKREGPKEDSTGIGLENTISRLKWTYKEHYSFQTTNESHYFKAELRIPLYPDI